MSYFTEGDPKYRCCCQCMHVRTGALIIGIIQDVGILMAFMRFTRVTASLYDHTIVRKVTVQDENGTLSEIVYEPGFKDVIPSLVSALLFVFGLAATVCLFWGVCKNRPRLLIPELILLFLSMLLSALAILFFVVVLAVDSTELNIYIKEQLQASGYDDMPDTIRFISKIVAGVSIALYLGTIALTYWFFRVVRNCYKYLQDKRLFLDNEPAGARYAVGGGGIPGTIGERQPIVIIQPPSSGGGADGQSPPPAYTEKY